jgi:hypothetical protein
MLLMIAYQVITGHSPNVYWDIISAVALVVAICGDSIILLLHDKRWKAGEREIMAHVKRIFRSWFSS